MLTSKQLQLLYEKLEEKKKDAVEGNVMNIVTVQVQASNSGVYNTCVEIDGMIRSVLSQDDDDEEK